MAQQGLKQDDQGNWINYNISDSKDTGWNDSIINAKLEKNVDSGPKRAVFTADTVKNEIDTDPYNGAYDDYIPWWLQKDGEGGKDDDNSSRSRTTVDPADPFFKKRDSYEEVFGKPTLGAQTYNLTGKSIQELYAEKELPGKTIGQHLSKGLTLGVISVASEKWKDKSLEAEIKRREASNLRLHGTKTPTQAQVLGEDDRDTGAKPGGQTPLSEVTIGGKSATDIGARRGKGGTIITKDKPYEGPTGEDAEHEQERAAEARTQSAREASRGGVGRSTDSSSDKDNSAGGCVVATHAVNAGVFDLSTKRQAIRWCVKNLHRTWWGEAIRRGYRYYGQKAIDQGTVKKHYQEFKNYLAFATGKKRNLKNTWTFLYRTIQFFIKGITI
tara:strand:- start:145 stop:1299 length:1155 start_codon:yes stop_codon:yes gene_type:complete